MDPEKRIQQFEELVKDDPGNDMAHFSLGGAYAQAGRHEDAARAYLKAVEVNEGLSKAYQLAGAAFIAAGRTDDAADILRRGYATAASRGDLMPKKAIEALLQQIGVEPPAVDTPAAGSPGPDGSFVCARTGRPGTRMARPPFRGPIGQWIQDRIAKETFDDWIGLGTKVINELKLDLSNDEHDAVYDYAMRRYIGLTDETYRELAGQEPPTPTPEYREVIDQILSRMGDLEAFQGQLDERINR